MNKIISFILIALCLVIINTRKIAPTNNNSTLKCPGRCNCPTIYQPVCGKSGNTHGNSCLAKCFKDPVLKVGECSPKCLKDTIVKKNSCKVEPYGRTGTRNYCCNWIEVNGKKRKEICDYKGPATYVYQKSKCSWKKIAQNKKQKVCCSWTRTRTGRVVKNTNKVCKNGEVLEISRKIGCRNRPFGQFGIRKFCCSHKTSCVGKSCRITHRRCSYKGPTFTERVVRRCKWVQKTKNQRQVQCCRFTQNCRINNKTQKKRCLKRNKKCSWVGIVITSSKFKRCTNKPFGKNGIRTHCCSYTKKCKGKRCRHVNIKCQWEGCARYQRLKYKCSYIHLVNNSIRKQCCRWTETSECKKKIKSSKTCNWIGKAIVTTTKNGCKWETNGKNARRLVCCQFNKQCQGKKCKKSKRCVVKRTVYSRVYSKCSFKKYNKYTKRKRCCSYIKRCTGLVNKVVKTRRLRVIKKRRVVVVKNKYLETKKKETLKKRFTRVRKDRKVSRKTRKVTKRRKTTRRVNRRTTRKITRRVNRRTTRRVTRNNRRIARRTTATRRVTRQVIFQPRRFVPPAGGRVFRRRGRGDVWLQTKKGKWVDVNCVGTFRFLTDKKIKLRVQVQFRRIKRGSVIGSIAIRARNTVIVANRKGVVRVNGKKYKKSRIFDFRNKGFKVFKLKNKKRTFEIRGLRKERISFKYLKDTKSYIIVTGSIAKHHKGLYTNPTNPKKYVVKRNKSYFKKYVSFKLLPRFKATKLEKLGAKKCCRKLKSLNKRRECSTDFIRTGLCFAKDYKSKTPRLSRFSKKRVLRRGRRVIRRRRTFIYKAKSMKCKVVKRGCRYIGQTIFNKLKRGCKWKKVNKVGKRKYCCNRRTFCVGKKCRKIVGKCKFIGKIIKISLKKSCSIQTYGKKGSRRKLCCQWRNYCTGLKKFQCRPINKKCTWVGKIYQKIAKTTCKWEKKTRNQKQRLCCRWLRSCVVSKNNKRNCQDGPKKCSWTGYIIKNDIRRLCNFRIVGKFARRKYCCNHFRKCQDSNCKIQRKGCKFVGPTYSRTPASNCKWRKVTKNTKRKKCCYWTNYCVGKRCYKSKKTCKFVGVTIKVSRFRKCYWKQVEENGLYGRRRECCTFKKIKGSKGTKLKKVSCLFIGKLVLLDRTYFKRDIKCTQNGDKKTCCKRIHKCSIKDKKHECTFYKNEKCTITLIKITLPTNPSICVSSGDPHYTTFTGKRFDYYKLGDFILAESKTFTIHTRLRQWGQVSVNTGFAAKVNNAGETIETESKDGSEFILNGNKKLHLNVNEKHYFRNGGYIHRVSSKLVKVVSQNGDYMDVEVYPYNNKNQPNYQDHYMNIILRVANRNNYRSGFCISSDAQHAKGLFFSEYNPQQPVKVAKCSVEKRRKTKKLCKKQGITSKAGLLRCILDVCYNMSPVEEKAREILKEEENLKPTPKPQIKTPIKIFKQKGVCSSLGDPHYKTFSGKKFDNYFVGDFVLVKSKGFTVHTRTRKWGNASVNKRIAARLSGDLVEAKSADKFILNGSDEIKLNVGQEYKLPKGGLVKRISQTRVYYYSFKKGWLDAEFLGSGKLRYVNLIVTVPHWPETTGACQGTMIQGKGLFKTELKTKERKHPFIESKKCHDSARLKCIEKGVGKRFLASCIIDVCAGLGTKAIRAGIKDLKQDQ